MLQDSEGLWARFYSPKKASAKYCFIKVFFLARKEEYLEGGSKVAD